MREIRHAYMGHINSLTLCNKELFLISCLHLCYSFVFLLMSFNSIHIGGTIISYCVIVVSFICITTSPFFLGWASRVYYSDNGSTAIEIALKMAFRKFSLDHGILSESEKNIKNERNILLKVFYCHANILVFLA